MSNLSCQHANAAHKEPLPFSKCFLFSLLSFLWSCPQAVGSFSFPLFFARILPIHSSSPKTSITQFENSGIENSALSGCSWAPQHPMLSLLRALQLTVHFTTSIIWLEYIKCPIPVQWMNQYETNFYLVQILFPNPDNSNTLKTLHSDNSLVYPLQNNFQ